MPDDGSTVPASSPDQHDDGVAPPARASIGERVERGRIGQAAIAGLVAVLLAGQVATHLPSSATQRAARPPADQALRLLGSEQAWGVFSPDPRSTSLGLEARITFADGSEATWTLPDGPAVGANLRYYRWRKWLERVRADSARSLWAPTASWLADVHSDGPSPPVRVELVRRFRDNRPIGEQPEWDEAVFHTLELDPPEAEP